MWWLAKTLTGKFKTITLEVESCGTIDNVMAKIQDKEPPPRYLGRDSREGEVIFRLGNCLQFGVASY